MAFEGQRFTEADQLRYDSFGLENPLNSFKYPRWWVVDQAREAYLVSFGGQGYGEEINDHPPNYYALIWGAHVITFEARHKVITRPGIVDEPAERRPIAIMKYQLACLVVPTAVRDQWTTIVLMIRDAFRACHCGASDSLFDDVLVVPEMPRSL